MNIKQLERVLVLLKEIGKELNTDPPGISVLNPCYVELHNKVIQELKELVWKEYLKEE